MLNAEASRFLIFSVSFPSRFLVHHLKILEKALWSGFQRNEILKIVLANGREKIGSETLFSDS